MEIKRLFSALWRKAWIMLILALLGGGMAGYLNIYRTVPVYQADCTLYIFNLEKVLQKGQTLNLNDLNFSRQLVQNFSELIKSRRVTSEAINKLKTNNISFIDPAVLNSVVSLGTQKDSNIFVVSAKWTDPQTAALISNSVSRAFVDTLNGLTNSKSIDILDEAVVPTYPLSNSATKKIIIGILAGIVSGFGIIYVMELFDTTVRTVEDIERNLNLKVVGIIPVHKIK